MSILCFGRGDAIDDLKYANYQDHQHRLWESLCRRCGACCGVIEGDPCEHLIGSKQEGYACAIYGSRYGTRKTVSGKVFQCVPIRDILHQSWPGDQCCGYKKSRTSS